MKLSRRAFIGGACASIPVLSAGAGLAMADTTSDVEYTAYDVALPARAEKLDGIKIAFLTDIHFGSASPPKMLEQIIQKVNAAAVDLVLLGGDNLFIPSSALALGTSTVRNPRYAHGSLRVKAKLIYHDLASLLSTLNARYGVFSVYGNHDHWIEPKLLRAAYRDTGIAHHANHIEDIMIRDTRLRLMMIDDYLTGIPRPPEIPRMIEENEYRVVLTHNPDLYGKLLALPDVAFDLGLSGHTHGGQIELPWIGALSYRIRDLRFWKGWTKLGETQFFTSRGIGVVEIPYRINCRPEVAFLTLRASSVTPV
ncbi:MAG: metallophosphoesterase [Bdellovibrionales bacterium]|nr:metallophosphoesterase [Bdellovibrionales bacterium]